MVCVVCKCGFKVFIFFMGYYNFFFSYGEECFFKDCKEVGVNGFIIVDLFFEEVVFFCRFCICGGFFYVFFIVFVILDVCMCIFCQFVDFFIYVVFCQGVIGVSGILNVYLLEFFVCVKKYSGDKFVVVGFGVSICDYFQFVFQFVDGVVVGSQIVIIIMNVVENEINKVVQEYCGYFCGCIIFFEEEVICEVGIFEVINGVQEIGDVFVDVVIKEMDDFVVQFDMINFDFFKCFGEFGGQYVLEFLMDCFFEFEDGFNKIKDDLVFWEEYCFYYFWMGCFGYFYLVECLMEYVGGVNIWFKREDFNYIGFYKINNVFGQFFFVRRLGKIKIIVEIGVGQYGVVIVIVCVKFGMECIVFMGVEDVCCQVFNVFCMKFFGVKVVVVEVGSCIFCDVVNEVFCFWVVNFEDIYYIIGFVIGFYFFFIIVCIFQFVIGREIKQQMFEKCGKFFDVVVVCVGGGFNVVGMFYFFVEDRSVKMLGVEVGGDGVDIFCYSVIFIVGFKGVFYGVWIYIFQNEYGQIDEIYFVFVGFDYFGVGFELFNWKDIDCVKFIVCIDVQVFIGFCLMSQLEGIIFVFEFFYGIWGVIEFVKIMKKGEDVVICLSGCGDKDVQSVVDELFKIGFVIGWDLCF